MPEIRPLNCLRYLVFFGDSIGQDSSGVRLFAALAARASLRTVAALAAPALARRPALAGQALVQRHRVVLEDLALEDPDLHPDDPVGGLGLGKAVVHVGAQGVQRHAALAVPLHPRDLGAAQAAGDVDADALGAQAHGRLHRSLHGPAEGDPTLELLGDVL